MRKIKLVPALLLVVLFFSAPLRAQDKIEIFGWIDLEIADDLVCRIGMDRSLQIRQEIEQKCKVTTIERRIHLGDAAQDSVNYAGQASP